MQSIAQFAVLAAYGYALEYILKLSLKYLWKIIKSLCPQCLVNYLQKIS